MDADALRADCARCAALCCVALAFDRSAKFGYEKPAGAPCRHLGGDDRCRIYPRRDRSGFSGCVQFDCLGAGQRVVQELFAGRSWRDDPAVLIEMSRCFSVLRRLHELLVLLNEAARLDLSSGEREVLKRLHNALDPAGGWSPCALLGFDVDRIAGQARSFLTSLRPHVAALPRLPSPRSGGRKSITSPEPAGEHTKTAAPGGRRG